MTVQLLYSILTNFYPSFLLTFFNNAIQFAKETCDIPDNNTSVIMHAKDTLSFSNGEPLVKNDGDEDFNVPMECYDGAEICEPIGSYLLYQINNFILKENIGLYRDDGRGIFKKMSYKDI